MRKPAHRDTPLPRGRGVSHEWVMTGLHAQTVTGFTLIRDRTVTLPPLIRDNPIRDTHERLGTRDPATREAVTVVTRVPVCAIQRA